MLFVLLKATVCVRANCRLKAESWPAVRDTSGHTAKLLRLLLLLAVTAIQLNLLQFTNKAAAFETKIHIRAVVPAFANIMILQEPSSLVITDEDLRRGYVDVDAPVVAAIRSNSRDGCLIEMMFGDFPVREIIVRTTDRIISMNSSGGVFPLQVMGRQEVAFSFRFVFSPETRAGRYGWLLYLSAAPAT